MVVFVTGGAWLIGYKAWGELLGRMLAQLGILVFSVDYRNFPEATVKEMYQDVEAAVAWVFAHAKEYGGDPERVSLCGQSAGAHLTACLLAQRAREQVGEGPATVRWTVSREAVQCNEKDQLFAAELRCDCMCGMTADPSDPLLHPHLWGIQPQAAH